MGRKKIEDGYKTPQARYDAANTVFVGVKLVRASDADIISWLETQPNKQGAIKQAVRDYLARSHREG